MKKLALLLLALAIVAPLFADDAKVLPAGVLRTTLATVYSTFDESYDPDGEAQDFGDEIKMLALGAAVEYGVTDQITAGIQWAPGYNVWSESKNDDKADANAGYDMFIGAKAQILGPNGFVTNDVMRFALGLGMTLPIAYPDWEEEATNFATGKEYTGLAPSTGAYGIGTRLAFDYLISDSFFINLYNESIFYLPVDKKGTNLQSYTGVEQEYKHGYKLTFEIEPNYTYAISETFDVSGSLPFTYTMTPELEVDGNAVSDTETTFLKVTPYVSAFLKAPVPLEFKTGYSVPLMGKNTQVTSSFIFQLKSYLKF